MVFSATGRGELRRFFSETTQSILTELAVFLFEAFFCHLCREIRATAIL